jgi:hypothetical protein
VPLECGRVAPRDVVSVDASCQAPGRPPCSSARVAACWCARVSVAECGGAQRWCGSVCGSLCEHVLVWKRVEFRKGEDVKASGFCAKRRASKWRVLHVNRACK